MWAKKWFHEDSPTNELRLRNVTLSFFEVTIFTSKLQDQVHVMSLERINFWIGYQKVGKSERNDVTQELGHTHLVFQSNSSANLGACLLKLRPRSIDFNESVSIWLPDDEFDPGEVNSSKKFFLQRCNCLCIWGKAFGSPKCIGVCHLLRQSQICFPSRSMSIKNAKLLPWILEACVIAWSLYKNRTP